MNTQRFEQRVRFGATVLMLLVGAELIRYTIHSFRRAYQFSFGEPDRWNKHWKVDEGTVIELALRAQYFSIWALVILVSIASSFAAMALLRRIRRSEIFEPETARGIQWVGGLIVLTMVLDTIFGAVDLWMVTLQNADGPEPIRYLYDPSDLKASILGIVLFLFGFVMREAISVDRENREYV